jgi:hypothetical protein
MRSRRTGILPLDWVDVMGEGDGIPCVNIHRVRCRITWIRFCGRLIAGPRSVQQGLSFNENPEAFGNSGDELPLPVHLAFEELVPLRDDLFQDFDRIVSLLPESCNFLLVLL